MKIKYTILLFLFGIILWSCKIFGELKSGETITNKQVQESPISCDNPSYKSGQLIAHTYYNLQYAEQHEQAYWVSYVLYPDFLVRNATRKNRFKRDLKVTTGSASLQDYKGSGFDRGHIAPAGSMVFNQKAMDESFYMSNMSPQYPSFNRGVWKRLESQVRKWAQASDSLFVVTGPVLNAIDTTIGENKVSVPKQYYKVLVRFKDNDIHGIAFLLENTASKETLDTFTVSIDSIEILTEINFNPNWNIKTEAKIEAGFELIAWDF
jgi:endonuclease G